MVRMAISRLFLSRRDRDDVRKSPLWAFTPMPGQTIWDGMGEYGRSCLLTNPAARAVISFDLVAASAVVFSQLRGKLLPPVDDQDLIRENTFIAQGVSQGISKYGSSLGVLTA